MIDSTRIKWMDNDGPENDIVISSRIRIARNLAGVSFSEKMNATDIETVFNTMQLVIAKFESMQLIRLDQLSNIERNILMEKHLISPDLLKNPEQKAVVLSDDQIISIMINEEDHLRLQCLLPGLQLYQAWKLINELDDLLEQKLEYAFSEQWGYLTSCPTNVGTGLRASVMLHLPALVMSKQIDIVTGVVSMMKLAIRGLYGEGSEAVGNLYQISNQITLGRTEEEILNSLIAIIKHLIEQEREARQALQQDKKHWLEDRVFRAYGMLKNARLLTADEAMKLISDVRLGVDLNIIPELAPAVLNELIIMTRPVYLIKQAQKELNSLERDVLRAELVRNKLVLGN